MPIQKILLKFEPSPENVLPALKQIQKENGKVGPEECDQVAKYFSLPAARVYSLASFFDDLKVKKDRKRIIRVCCGGACLMKNSHEIVRQIELFLKVEIGNDAHPKYKLEFMSCRGVCDQGPVVTIDEQVFEKVRPETVDDILQNYC